MRPTKEQAVRMANMLEVAREGGSRALEAFGADAQELQAIEECAELISAIAHHRRGRAGDRFVCSEVADVLIMAIQMAQRFGWDDTIEELGIKISRLRDRLDERGAR